MIEITILDVMEFVLLSSVGAAVGSYLTTKTVLWLLED